MNIQWHLVLLLLFAYLGLFFGGAALLLPALGKCSESKFVKILIFCTCWFLALSLNMAWAGFVYYADAQIRVSFWGTILFGTMGMSVAAYHRNRFAFIVEAIRNRTCFSRSWHPGELVGASLLLLLFLTHVYRVFSPWHDHDEMAAYGYFAKSIANGISYSELLTLPISIAHAGPKLIEALDAQWLYAGGGYVTFFSRLLRLIHFVVLGSALYGFCRLAGATSVWGVFTVGAIFGIPELGYLLTSLKLDGLVMCYELMGIMLVMFAFNRYAENTTRLRWAYAGVFLCAAAFGSRQSGLYSLTFGLVTFLYMLFREQKEKKAIWIISLLALCIFFTTYVSNIFKYGNPIFPFDPPWPFHNGQSAIPLDRYREWFNLNTLSKPVQWLYLPVHLGLGLEIRKTLSFVPHSSQPGVAMEWLSPALLSIYIVPFFVNRVRAIAFPMVFFIFVYTFWMLGVQYSRVFMAASSIPIVINSLIVAHFSKAASNRTTPLKLSLFALKFLLFGATLVGVWTSYRGSLKYTHSLSSVWSHESRIQAACGNFKRYGLSECMSTADALALDEILSRNLHMKILIASTTTRVIHIAFRNSLFMEYEATDVNRDDYHCVLVDRNRLQDSEIDRKAFTVLQWQSSNKNWNLFCRDSL